MEKRSLKDILSSPKYWVKRTLARTKSRLNVVPGDNRAVQWCLVGAVWKVCGTPNSPRARRIIAKLATAIGTNPLWEGRVGPDAYNSWLVCVEFNNHRKTKFGDIQELIEKAKV